jgi:transcriptional regulator with XRE-family HTH domain
MAKRRVQNTKASSRDKEIDGIIGEAIRSHRAEGGLSQRELGESLGVTFQQIQKYESGKNSVSASRIPDLCNALGVSVEQLFEGTGIKKTKR